MVVFEVDDVVEEADVERKDRTGDEWSGFVCGVTEGWFWKSLRMSTLVGLGLTPSSFV